MSGDAADATTATGSRSGEVDMRIIGFCAPEWMVCFIGIVVKKRKIQIAVEDISTRQRNVLLEVGR